MYTETNFKSKKALRDALAAGKIVHCYQPGGMFPGTVNGNDAIEGPHYPAPHSWYASVTLRDGIITHLDGKSVEKLRAAAARKNALNAAGLESARPGMQTNPDESAIASAVSRGMISETDAAILRDMIEGRK